jgi:hypothetical protein
VEIQILVGGHGKIGYGFAIKNHGKARQNLFLDTDNGSIKTRSGLVMAWYREENFTSQFQIRNGKSTY